MAYTGGPLNELSGKMSISAPHKSVPVMKLINIHNPKSKEELVDLIEFHYLNDCKCGIKSQGTVEDFGKNLYNSQKMYWGEIKFSLKECIQWEYDLFVIQSLKGGIIEKKALEEISTLLTEYNITESRGYLDEELRIDLVVTKDRQQTCGIQVKPSTFLTMRREVITFNAEANKQYNKPVYYLFYDSEENFENLSELINKIKEL